MLKFVLQAVFLLALASPGLAQDWVVTRVRGTVEQQADGRWIGLVRGASLQDQQSIRTGKDGRVDLARGAETIVLDPGTQIRLQEGAGKLTSLIQSSGVVIVDVERRNVQHFSVQTPFLAAVVKGTRFQVAVTDSAARVEVERGIVQVQDSSNGLVVDVTRGQQAAVSQYEPLTVSGPGPIGVFTFDGSRIVNGTFDTPADGSGKYAADGAETTALGDADGISSRNIGNARRNGNSDNSNAGGNGNGNSGNSNAGGDGNGNSGNSNAGGNSANSKAGGNGSDNGYAGGNSENSNAGGNGNGQGNGNK